MDSSFAGMSIMGNLGFGGFLMGLSVLSAVLQVTALILACFCMIKYLKK